MEKLFANVGIAIDFDKYDKDPEYTKLVNTHYADLKAHEKGWDFLFWLMLIITILIFPIIAAFIIPLFILSFLHELLSYDQFSASRVIYKSIFIMPWL